MDAMKNPHAVALGKIGGSVKSEVKSKSSRENGKLGGRPKKLAESVDSFGIPLMEMANAIQKYTGLPGVIYFSTKDEVKQTKSLGRVKWRNGDEEVFVSIKPDKDGKRKCGGDNRRMIAQLEKFIIANEDILWSYWNTPADQADSAAVMKRFVKV